jgi:hypothetical protein
MTMGGAKKLKVLGGAFIVLLLLNSCADFFSTSWGEAFKRDPDKVKVTEDNVYELLDAAKGDPELSRAILNKINADSSDKLKRAAIQAANQAAGITTLAMENVQILIDAGKGESGKNNESALQDVADKILGSAKKNDLPGVSAKLVEILENEVDTPKGRPVFQENIVDGVSEADLTLLAMTLVLAEAGDDVNAYAKTWESKDVKAGADSLNPKEKLIAASVNGMIDKGDKTGQSSELTKMLKDLLKVKD